MRARGSAALALLLAATFPALVSAHAQLLGATPAPDQTLTTLPPFMVLTYDDALRDDSSFIVLDGGGRTVVTGATRITGPLPSGAPDPTDPKSLVAVMPVLADGRYQVNWTAISADDGFIERGSFKFTVALGSPAPSPATTEPGAAASAGPSALPTGGSSSAGGSATDVLVPIAVAGILVGVGLGWFMRRRGPA